MVFNNNLLLGAAGQGGAVYEIDQSIRFNDGDSPYLNRTFGTPTSSSQFGYSFWVKLGAGYDGNYIISANGGGNNDNFSFSSNQIRIQEGGVLRLQSDQLFRDFSSWYHFVVAYDLGNATASQKLRVYLNGSEITSWATDTRSSFSGTSSRLNAAVGHDVGANVFNGVSSHINNWDGYIAEFHFVDGTVLTPADFGEYNDDGVWIPIEASPTYGNNGFYLTGATASDLGEDFSGNGNDFTSSGLTTADQMLDTPTNNMPTLNPLSSGTGTLSDGNLQYVGVSGNWSNSRLNLLVPDTGKWAIRCKTTTSYSQMIIGLCAPDSASPYTDIDINGVAQIRYNALDGNFVTRVTGSLINDTSPPTTAAQTFIQLLFDMDNGKMGIAADGATSGTFADIATYPTLDLNGASLSTARQPFVQAYAGIDSGAGVIIDVGQSGWETTVTGFKNLILANLDTPSITDGSKYFNTVLYEGNGGGQRVGQFQPITETYTVPNSVIFNDNDSASLTRTPSSAGNRRTFTFSCWVKRANLTGANQPIFTASGSSWIMFLSGETLGINFDSSGNYRIVTNQVFKDTSSWFHVVLRVDTTNATADDRLRMYINGSQVTDFGTRTNPPLNADTDWNNTGEHRIGKLVGASQYFDGYLAEINHIDGQSLGPDSFGQLDASTNKWIPKDASGLTFGTNGFYLDMETAPGTGSGAGTDSSGNGNNWTESGLAAADQVDDSPTDNQSVLDANRIDAYTLSQGNLFTNAVGDAAAIGTIPFDPQDEGGFYFEAKVKTAATYPNVGIRTLADIPTGSGMSDNTTGRYAYTGSNGQFNDEGTGVSYGDVWAGTADKVIGVYIKAGELFFSVDGTIQNSGTPAKTGLTGLMVPTVFYDAGSGTHASWEMRFNSSEWSTTPSGYKSISTDNLPLSNGDLSAFVWIKNRDATDNHMLFDAVRGATKDVHSNATSLEATNANTLTRFLKNGFEVSNDAEVNTSGESYVAWQWLNDSLTTSSNTDGDITSTVLANTTAGYSIVTATPSLTGTENIGHGIGIAPKMILGKNLEFADNWYVYHDAISPAQSISLNTTGAATTTRYNAATTSSVFQIVNGAWTNGGQKCLWYCFAEVEGFSKFDSYTGNGSTDGPFVYTGFKPAFVMFKVSSNAPTGWAIIDNKRSNPFNPTDGLLQPDQSNAEGTTDKWDILSNGFKVRTTWPAVNGNGYKVTYMAFAENPFGGDGAAPATAR